MAWFDCYTFARYVLPALMAPLGDLCIVCSSLTRVAACAGNLAVRVKEERQVDCDIIHRRMSITHASVSRDIDHYLYHAWPDHGVPTSTRPLRQLASILVRPHSQRRSELLHPATQALATKLLLLKLLLWSCIHRGNEHADGCRFHDN